MIFYALLHSVAIANIVLVIEKIDRTTAKTQLQQKFIHDMIDKEVVCRSIIWIK